MIYHLGQQITLRAKFGTNLTELSDHGIALASTIKLRDVTGYSAAGLILLDANADTEEVVTIASVSGHVVTLTAPLLYSHQQNEPVMLLTDPTTVTLRLRVPSGTITPYTFALAEIVKDAVGRYSKLVTPTVAGDYLVRWQGTGTVVTAAESGYAVRASVFP